MKHASTSVVVGLAMFTLAGVGHDVTSTIRRAKANDGGHASPSTGTTTQADPAAAAEQCKEPALPVCSDAQVAAIVRAANQAEVDVSNAVIDQLASEATREFAQRIIDDHTTALEELDRLLGDANLTPVENDVSAAIDEEADQAIAALEELDGSQLDRAYLAQQLLAHLQTLSTGDHVLLPSAKNTQLTEMIRTKRPVLVQHTQEATQVQSELGRACGGEDDQADGGTQTDDGDDE
jgi:putative membrane protein